MVKKIEVMDAGLPSRPQMQSPLHNRRIQRIGLFAFLFLALMVFGLYNRSSWTATELYGSGNEVEVKDPTSVVPHVDESQSPKPPVVSEDIEVDPVANTPNTPPSTPQGNPIPKTEDKKPNTQTPATTPAGTVGLDETRIALIIETRPIPHLPALINTFISILPPQWVFKHIGDQPAFDLIKSHHPLQRHIDNGKLVLVPLPDQYPTTNNEDLSATLTNITFYRDFLAPAEWLLMFQTDSMICSGSDTTLDDWVDKGYDWTGAPWHPNRKGGNGGLSLRHIPPIVKLLETETRKANDSAWEDVWLCERLENAAPAKLEESFSVESVWNDKPFGYHLRGSGKLVDPKIWGDQDRRKHIFEYCPETKIIMAQLGLDPPKKTNPKTPATTKTPATVVDETPFPEGPKDVNKDQNSYGEHDKEVNANESGKPTVTGMAEESKALKEAEAAETGRWEDAPKRL